MLFEGKALCQAMDLTDSTIDSVPVPVSLLRINLPSNSVSPQSFIQPSVIQPATGQTIQTMQVSRNLESPGHNITSIGN